MQERVIIARLETCQHRQAPQNQMARRKGIAQRKRRHALGRMALALSALGRSCLPVSAHYNNALRCVYRVWPGLVTCHQSFGALVYCTAATRTPKVPRVPRRGASESIGRSPSDALAVSVVMPTLKQCRCICDSPVNSIPSVPDQSRTVLCRSHVFPCLPSLPPHDAQQL